MQKNKVLLILGNIYFIFATLTLTLLVLPLCYLLVLLHKLFPKHITSLTIHKFSYLYGRAFCFVNAPVIPVKVKGSVNLSSETKCIFIANHQSFLDLYLFAKQPRRDFCYVLKSWPFRILFFFAPMMRASGYINVENVDTEEIHQKCMEKLQTTSLVIFPEGKRSRDGSLGRFYTGAFRLAIEANVPLVPIIFENTYDVFAPGAKMLTPQEIGIAILDPIYPTDFISKDLPHRELMRFAKKQYTDYFANLEKKCYK